jgi:molybdenum cofactor cytidylyltransferase
MKFARIPLSEAAGAILGHSLHLAGGMMKKGRKLGAEDVARLRAAGHTEVVAAVLESDDVGEDDAAAQVAAAVAGAGVRAAPATTGRCNLHADAAGLASVRVELVDRLNAIDESVTVATVPPFAVLAAGDMVATVKIIPFAARREVVDACRALGPMVGVARFRRHEAGLVLTRLPGTPEALLDRPAQTLGTRLAAAGSVLAREIRCAHDDAAVAAAVRELLDEGRSPILVLGVSAIADRHDVVPAALERAGGVVDHVGMPVDPGNLLMLGHHGATPVIGVPGCARSLRPSGFDWVLARLLAGIPVTGADMEKMGVGGLLKDVPERGAPRVSDKPDKRAPRVSAVVLAAGLSRRMGENKLLVPVAGRAMVARVVGALAESPVAEVVVVVGHEADRVRAALADAPARPPGRVRFVDCPDYAQGLSASLRAGIAALGPDVDAALVCLGDMPWVSARHAAALIDAFDPAAGRAVCVPFFEGKRGNPVLWAARYFAEMQGLSGDVGARELLERHAEAVWPVPVTDAGVTVDIDTREALEALRGGEANVP